MLTLKLVKMFASNGSVWRMPKIWVLAVFVLELVVCNLNGVSAQQKSQLNVVQSPSEIVDRSVHLMKSSLLFGVLSEFVSLSNANGRCNNEVQIILDGIRLRKVWALKILDTGPNVPTAFVFGNNFWFTATSLCTYLNAPVQITHSASIPKNMGADLLNSTSPVRLKHRMVYANFTSPMQIDVKFHVNPIVHIGLCLPESCENTIIQSTVQSYLKTLPLPMMDLYDLNMTVIGSKATDYDMVFITSTAFVLLGCTVLFVIITIILDRRHQTSDSMSVNAQKGNSVKNLSVYSRVVNCFDIAANWESIFTDIPSKGLTAVDGIRTIACMWVLIFHVSYHSAFTVENTPQLIIKMEWFIYQPIFQAYLYVDSFFVLSGVLLVYNFMRNESKRNKISANSTWSNVKFFTEHMVHRYIRLTPMLIVTMILSELLYSYLGLYSPFWLDQSSDLDCKDTWWMNMFYLQNFLSLNTICSSWTWYLACDMQFYIATLFVLFVYTKSEKTAKYIFYVVTAAALSISFYFSFAYSLTYEIDVIEANSNWLYTKPWMRMNPFMGGIFSGWFIHRVGIGKPPSFRKLSVWLYWALATCVFVFTIFMTYKRDAMPIWFALLLSIGKFVFGLYIGSIVMMCHLGYGNSLSKVFNNILIRHLSKLTFSMYMVSPLVVTAINGIKEVSTHFDEATTAVNIFASITASYLLAIILSVFFELPFQKLSDQFVLKRKKPARS